MFYIYSILGLLAALHGLNNSAIYYGVISATLAISIKNTQLNYLSLLRIAIAIIILFLEPSYTVLYGFLALLFFHPKVHSISGAFLGFWILELVGFTPTSYGMIVLVFLVCLTVLKCIPYSYAIYRTSILLPIALSLTSIFTWKEATPIEKQDYRNAYAPGSVLAQNTNSRQTIYSPQTTALVRSHSFPSKSPRNFPGVLSFDIDYNGGDPVVSTQQWSQPTPWNQNMFFGNQYWIEAIRNDGALFSNKGVVLKPTGRTMLSYPNGFWGSTSLAVLDDKTLILHDTDYITDYISNYQRALDQEIVGSPGRPRSIRIINCAFLIFLLIITSFQTHTRAVKIAFTVITILFLSSLLFYKIKPHKGHIRIVGKIQNSHENYKADGVPKKVVAAGYPYIIGEKDCHLLVIKENNSTHWRGERIIVGEPGAKITIGTHTYTAGISPLGNKMGVADAREWYLDGKPTNSPLIRINNITMIATGSPAILSWASIIK
jgi:membrane protein